MNRRNVVSEPFSCVNVTLVAKDGVNVDGPPPSTGDMGRLERGSKPGMPGDVGVTLRLPLCERTGKIVYSTRKRIGLHVCAV